MNAYLDFLGAVEDGEVAQYLEDRPDESLANELRFRMNEGDDPNTAGLELKEWIQGIGRLVFSHIQPSGESHIDNIRAQLVSEVLTNREFELTIACLEQGQLLLREGDMLRESGFGMFLWKIAVGDHPVEDENT